MKIRALCVVKNEADIVGQTLRAAANWSDKIYVLDNGSDDGTWELVKTLADEFPQIVPFDQIAIPFDDSIRNRILAAYTGEAQEGDWWCIQDADEFFVDDPRTFLNAVPARCQSVKMLLYTYLFTDKDRERFECDPSAFADDVPIQERLRHYVVGDYSELRFFRHTRGTKRIPMDSGFPVYEQLIRVKHYAYRSPRQIAKRLQTRLEPMLRGEFVHEKRSNWLPGGSAAPGPAAANELPQSWIERVTPHQECHFDRLDGVYAAGQPSIFPENAKTPDVPLFSRLQRKLASAFGSRSVEA